MLVLHLNGLQEVFQPEGNTRFGCLLRRIEDLCRTLSVPVGIKEVGWGIDGETARNLLNIGATFIDVAGAGGTSWSQVEKFRVRIRFAASRLRLSPGGAILPRNASWRCAKSRQPVRLSALAGRSGVDAAKAISLGADLAGFGRGLLGSAVESVEALDQRLAQVELEPRTAMFGIGAGNIDALKSTQRLIRV